MLRASKQRSANLGIGSASGIKLGLIRKTEDYPGYLNLMRKAFGASTFDSSKFAVLLPSIYLSAKPLSSVLSLESLRASEAKISTWFSRRL